MGKNAQRVNDDNYKPELVPKALKVQVVGSIHFNNGEGARLATRKDPRAAFNDTKQVRLVKDLEASLAYYRDVLGCEVDGWGHATRGGMRLILQQAVHPDDVRPNEASAKRSNYPTDWTGPDRGWDTFVDVNYEEFDQLLEELKTNGANIILGPIQKTHSNGMTFKNVYIRDPDGYVIVFG